jgi:Fe-S cluster biogenesis protein NfuA
VVVTVAAIVAAGAAAAVAAATATITDQEVSVPSQHLLDRVESVLDQQVRPDLRADGGDVVVVSIDDDNILQVRLMGACQGCSSSIMTLTMRVEATLKSQIPEIRFVEAVP